MWGDRFLFVTAALAAMAVWTSIDYSRALKQAGRHGVLSYLTPGLAIAIIIVVVVGRIWLYWSDWQWPTVSSVIAILIGTVFGSFTAKFVASLFSRDFGRRDPIIGAFVLLLLAIGYSLPLYGDAISSLLSKVGLSGVKTPFLEISFESQSKGRSATPQASGASNSHGEAVPRGNNPQPGLDSLKYDADPSFTLASDWDYVTFIGGRPKDFAALDKGTKQFLAPIKLLSDCLNKYVSIVPDSQLLLVDIKPTIASMYRLHAAAKRAIDPEHFPPEAASLTAKGSEATGPISQYIISEADLGSVLSSVKDVMTNVNNNFMNVPTIPECDTQLVEKIKNEKAPLSLPYLQPYASLVLADLLVTHGAADEAISVLAEWLNLWKINQERRTDLQRPADLPQWFPLRVRSRISILMSNLAGPNNRAYRNFFDDYKGDFENYIAASKQHPISRDNLSDKCDRWLKLSTDKTAKHADLINTWREQRLLYLLVQYENEALRTEMNFLTEQTQFEALDKLYNRAMLLTRIEARCFVRLSNDDVRLQLSDDDKGAFDRRLQLSDDQHPFVEDAFVAENRVIAGLVALTVADRMGSIARSSGDRERARDVHRRGEEELRIGWRDLRKFIEDDRTRIRHHTPLPDSIFQESQWERSATLATRALSQLRNEGD
jgi:hypothetical protein